MYVCTYVWTKIVNKVWQSVTVSQNKFKTITHVQPKQQLEIELVIHMYVHMYIYNN